MSNPHGAIPCLLDAVCNAMSSLVSDMPCLMVGVCDAMSSTWYLSIIMGVNGLVSLVCCFPIWMIQISLCISPEKKKRLSNIDISSIFLEWVKTGICLKVWLGTRLFQWRGNFLCFTLRVETSLRNIMVMKKLDSSLPLRLNVSRTCDFTWLNIIPSRSWVKETYFSMSCWKW